MSSGSVPSCFRLFLLLFLTSVSAEASLDNWHHHGQQAVQEAKERWAMEPAAAAAPLGLVVLSEARRRLGSFQICALCTCCGGPRRVCLPSPCCYAINCNIPNRPFGFCSFTPKSCNCFGCHL